MKNITFIISLCAILSVTIMLPMKRPAEGALESVCAKKIYVYTHIHIPQEHHESLEISPILNTQAENFNQIDHDLLYMPSNVTTQTEVEPESFDIEIDCTTYYIPPITDATMIENREPEQNYKSFWQPSSPSKFKIDWRESSKFNMQTETEPEDLGIQIDFDTCYVPRITQSTIIETVEPEENYNNSSLQPSFPATFTLSSPKKVPNKFACTFEECNQSPISNSALIIHLRTHTKEKPYTCTFEECDKSFPSRGSLATHIQSHYSDEKIHACPFEDCDKTYTTKKMLNEHKRTHTGEKPYACTFEGCPQSFVRFTGLASHMKTHTGEKLYKCTYEGCDKSFAQNNNLTVHMRTHTDEKAYSCTQCDKSYTDKSNLNRHMRTHTGKKSYICTFPGCGKSYIAKSNLTNHVRKHTEK